MSKPAPAPVADIIQPAPPALKMVALALLQPGNKYPGGSIDSRKSIEPHDDLVPSLRDRGVVIPLVVKYADGVPYVNEGNRRLRALLELVPSDKARATYLVPTVESGQGDALEISMEMNALRRDLHPVDQFEVFAVMVQAGATLDAIARRYLMTQAQVRQALGLAALAPEVRNAWRENKISGEAAEAFLLTKDHAAQVKVLKREKSPSAWSVERALGAESHALGKLLTFVTRAAYEKAGHFVNESLFTDENDRRQHVSVSDVGALAVMAREKVEAKCTELIAEGWAWAIPDDDKPKDIHAWKRVYPGANNKFATEVMKVAGCVVDVDYDAKLVITRGYVKPGKNVQLPKGATQTVEQKKATKAKREKRAADGPAVSNALASRISDQITLAVADVIRADAALAMPIAVAMLACSHNPSRLDIRPPGDWRKVTGRDANDFAKYLALVAGKSGTEQMKLLAHWISEVVELHVWQADNLPLAKDYDNDDGKPELLAYLARMAGDDLTEALLKRFNAEDYFDGMAADAARAALKEMGLSAPAGGKKSDMAKLAAKAARDKGWLPPEMRAGEKRKAKAPAKLPSARKAKRKARR